MTDENELWKLAGFVKGGGHRFDVFCYLARNGASIPSDVAEDLGKTQQRVHDAHKELERNQLIELKVPESQKKGRLRALTDLGWEVWELMQREGVVNED